MNFDTDNSPSLKASALAHRGSTTIGERAKGVVEYEFDRLIAAISELESVHAIVVDRLAPVLAPGSPEKPNGEPEAVIPVMIADGIARQRMRVQALIRSMAQLSVRIQL